MNPGIIVAKCMTLSWKQQFYGVTNANINYNLLYRSSHFNYNVNDFFISSACGYLLD